MNKKGQDMDPKSVLIGFLLILALFTILYFAFVQPSGEKGKQIANFTACGATSLTEGRCVKSKAECESLSGQFWSGLGCKGTTPYCCTGSLSDGSCTGDKISITAVTTNPEVLSDGQMFLRVRCVSNKESACLKVTKKFLGDASSPSQDCTLNKDYRNSVNPAEKEFVCGGSDYFKAGEHSFTCSVSAGCCADSEKASVSITRRMPG